MVKVNFLWKENEEVSGYLINYKLNERWILLEFLVKNKEWYERFNLYVSIMYSYVSLLFEYVSR